MSWYLFNFSQINYCRRRGIIFVNSQGDRRMDLQFEMFEGNYYSLLEESPQLDEFLDVRHRRQHWEDPRLFRWNRGLRLVTAERRLYRYIRESPVRPVLALIGPLLPKRTDEIKPLRHYRWSRKALSILLIILSWRKIYIIYGIQ